MSTLLELLSQIMVTALGLFHQLTRTYWLDIILLTVVVRLLMSPIYRSQTRYMKAMNELQPKLKQLQEQLKDQPQELSKQTWALWGEHKVKPWTGCLPMLIQMPVLISLFYVLRLPQYYKLLPGFEESSLFGAKLTVRCYEGSPYPNIESLPGMIDLGNIFHATFLFDKFLYLPAIPLFIIYIATTIFQTKLIQASNPQQKSNQMNFMMPLLLWIGLSFPVGLLLYFGLANVMQMQQYMSMKKKDSSVEKPSTEETGEEKKTEPPKPPPPPPPKKKRKKKK